MDKVQVINKIAEYYEITRNIDFAKYFGISPQVALSWTKGGGYNIYEVYRKCPDINPDWLLSLGEKGKMIRDDVPQPETESADESLGKALDSLKMALERLSEEQSLSKRILDQSDRVLKIVESYKQEQSL